MQYSVSTENVPKQPDLITGIKKTWDEKKAAIIDYSGNLAYYDLVKKKQVFDMIPICQGYQLLVLVVLEKKNQSIAFVAGSDETVYKVNLNTREFEKWGTMSGRVQSGDLSPSQDRCAFSDENRLLKVWEISTKKVLFDKKTLPFEAKSLRFFTDDKIFLGHYGELVEFNIAQNEVTRQSKPHDGDVYLEISSDRKILTTLGFYDKQLKIWHISEGQPEHETFNFGPITNFYANDQALDSKRLLVYTGDSAGRIRQWNIQQRKLTKDFGVIKSEWIEKFELFNYGKNLMVVFDDGSVAIQEEEA